MKELKKEVTKNFGRRCKDYSPLCGTCIAWNAYDTLQYLFDIK